MRTILRTSNCVSIYLQASVQTITERLKSEKDKRPLIAHLATDENLVEFVGKHLFERSSYYLKAQEKVIIDDLSSEEILEKIILKLF
jgi:shikimate kinase